MKALLGGDPKSRPAIMEDSDESYVLEHHIWDDEDAE